MSILSVILLVLFLIVCVVLIFLVSIQSDDDSGMGNFFGGTDSNSAFGGQTNKVISKITMVVAIAFAVLALCLAIFNTSSVSSLADVAASEQSSAVTSTTTE